MSQRPDLLAFFPFRFQVAVVLFGIPATLYFDSVAAQADAIGGVLFTVAFIPRVITYVILFASFAPLARYVAEAPLRTRDAAVMWFWASLVLGIITWYWMGRIDQISGEALTLYGPSAVDDTGAPLAQTAIGDAAGFYRWVVVISVQAVALVAVSCAAALYLHRCASGNKYWQAVFTPFVATMMIGVYAFLVPWVYAVNVDVYIGDVLMGGMLLNAAVFTSTLVWGGITAPAVWVSVLTLCNLALMRRWAGPLANPWANR